jgi:hypothetical protein
VLISNKIKLYNKNNHDKDRQWRSASGEGKLCSGAAIKAAVEERASELNNCFDKTLYLNQR